jgi:NADH dehydrogenase
MGSTRVKAGKTVTVFGGSGFIGRYVVARLADRGWTVRVAVRNPRRAMFLKPLGNVGQIVPIRTRLQSEEEVAAAVGGVDAVVNLVGILAPSGKQTFEAVQAQGAALIAKACAAEGIEAFVHVSAIGADPDSASDYARTKGLGERAVREALSTATILRPSIVFGPEDGFFNRFAAMARLSPALPLIGGGHTKFQPVYVGDVADAAVVALDSEAARGKTYELGGPHVYSFKRLMQILLKTIRRKRLLVPIPWAIAYAQGSVLQLLPDPPLTRDQVKLLESDNVVSEGALTLGDLGIDQPHSVEVIVPTYLDRYRPGGRFVPQQAPDAW